MATDSQVFICTMHNAAPSNLVRCAQQQAHNLSMINSMKSSPLYQYFPAAPSLHTEHPQPAPLCPAAPQLNTQLSVLLCVLPHRVTHCLTAVPSRPLVPSPSPPPLHPPPQVVARGMAPVLAPSPSLTPRTRMRKRACRPPCSS